MRKICYVSGARADYGLMSRTLKLAHDSKQLDIAVCVTGTHLIPQYGETVREIEADGLRVCARIPVHLDGSSGAVMAHAIADELAGMVDAFEQERPDVVVVLGDRGEMLAGAIAAIHLNVPVVHIHGGERSGTVDEPVRHAISKLAHYHFVATEGARRRLIQMGEVPERVFVTGAPGLDGLKELAKHSREELCAQAALDPERPIALVLFHPVLQEATAAGMHAGEIMQAMLDVGVQALCFMPNADAGGQLVRNVLMRYEHHPDIRLVTHLSRSHFVSWMAAADVMVGNSSSGIIEAASVGLRVVNVGIRQRLRERSANVLDVKPERDLICGSLKQALAMGRYSGPNVYGDGHASARIVRLLSEVSLDPDVLCKLNVY